MKRPAAHADDDAGIFLGEIQPRRVGEQRVPIRPLGRTYVQIVVREAANVAKAADQMGAGRRADQVREWRFPQSRPPKSSNECRRRNRHY